jgi:hypothetical protein
MEHSNACETQPHKSLLPNATMQGTFLSFNYGQDQTHKTVKRVLTQTLFVRSPFLQHNQPGISIHPEWWGKKKQLLAARATKSSMESVDCVTDLLHIRHQRNGRIPQTTREKSMVLSLVPTLHGRHANAPLEIHQTQ